jgi:hypothetical protein
MIPSRSRLKSDYIPRLGDRVDLVIVGACWDRIASEDRETSEQYTRTRGSCVDSHSVPPSPFTTFHLRVLANADMQSDKVETAPYHSAIAVEILPTAEHTSFMAFFGAPYRLSRDQLDDSNLLITSPNSATRSEHNKSSHQLGYDVSHFIGQSRPNSSVVLLKDSLTLVEVFGAGFTKAPGGQMCLLLVHPRHLLTTEHTVQTNTTNFNSRDGKSLPTTNFGSLSRMWRQR